MIGILCQASNTLAVGFRGNIKPSPFNITIVHSFSRFFRDHFELEFYIRKLAKSGVRLVSITQEMGDDPMHVMMRRMAGRFLDRGSPQTSSPGALSRWGFFVTPASGPPTRFADLRI